MRYFKVFGSKFYIQRDEDNLGKFDNRAHEGKLLGYSTKSKAYLCFNKRLNKIVGSAYVRVDESNSKDLEIAIGYDSYEFGEMKKEEENKSEEKND